MFIRIGRTGRAGESGEAISLCSRRVYLTLKDIQKLIKKDIEMVKKHPYS
jgi:ATP-dependent RNA helicase RhlE